MRENAVPPSPSPPRSSEEERWRHPWSALRTSLALLWRLSWRSDPRMVRRFVVLYGTLLAVLLLLGEAFLVIALALLRALWLSAPLYPGLVRRLERWGWPAAKAPPPDAPTRWRTLHALLWGLLIGLALVAAGWMLVARGFCAQNLICLAARLLGG